MPTPQALFMNTRPALVERGRMLRDLPDLVLVMCELPEVQDAVLADLAGDVNLPADEEEPERFDLCD